MLRTRGPGGTVEIDGFNYDWDLLSEPQLSSGAALAAGWDPGSRGKTLTFMVDANGD